VDVGIDGIVGQSEKPGSTNCLLANCRAFGFRTQGGVQEVFAE
jgi:hypothetical protein